MSRDYLMEQLIRSMRIKEKFDWNYIQGPVLPQLLSIDDIDILENIVRDPFLRGKIQDKIKYMNQILEPRGFKRIAAGTNRLVYKFYENQSFVLKVAVSKEGITDSPREMINQYKLMPYVTKCFDVSPGGAVGIFERVDPIKTVEHFYAFEDEPIELLDKIMRGSYIMADVGASCFKNYGYRIGFGLVLLDYPMLYKVDESKLFCNGINNRGMICGGAIAHDPRYDTIRCSKCNKQYFASELALPETSVNMTGFQGRKDITTMKIAILRDGVVIKETDSVKSTNAYSKELKVKTESENTTSSLIPEDENNDNEFTGCVLYDDTKEETAVEEETNTKEEIIDKPKLKVNIIPRDRSSINLDKY